MPIDELVTQILKNGPKTNKELRAKVGTSADPKLDRTLQKLRKDGKIQVVQGRWALSAVTICASCDGRGWVQLPKAAKKAK